MCHFEQFIEMAPASWDSFDMYPDHFLMFITGSYFCTMFFFHVHACQWLMIDAILYTHGVCSHSNNKMLFGGSHSWLLVETQNISSSMFGLQVI